MTFRFTLTDPIGGTKIISEPGGWDSASIGLERHPQLLSLVEYFKSSFQTYGSNGSEDGGRDWILNVEKVYGPDALIGVLVEIDPNDELIFRTLYSGNLGVGLFIETLNLDHLLQVVFANSDFWSKIMARWQTEVNLRSTEDLDGNVIDPTPKFTLPLPSQKINAKYEAHQDQSVTAVYDSVPNTQYGQIDFLSIILDEIEDRFTLGGEVLNSALPAWQWTAKYAGDYVFDWNVFSTTNVILGSSTDPGLKVKIQINDNAPINFTQTNQGTNGIDGRTLHSYAATLALQAKDIIRIYFYNSTGGIYTWSLPAGLFYDSYGKIFATTVFPDSTTEAFHTHDVAAGILDRISGRTGLFRSEYLGHQWTSRVYPSTGCGSLKANMKGAHVRGYVLEGDPDPSKNRPLAPSMRDWFDGINPIDCLGMGYNKDGVDDIVECELAEHFFDDSSMSILFSNVQTIKRSYDPNWQFNSIDYGYEKWQSQAANGIGTPSGIDDPQSQGTRNTIFKIIGKKLKIMSKWLAAGLAIETIRRLGILFSSNYTYDDQIIVIALHSNGDGTFTPELSEDFSAVTNLTNEETRYNKSITSTRNFLRWLPYVSGCLQSYLTSFFKFVPGQGNYTMTSTKTTSCPGDEMGVSIAENGDIAVGTDFLFLPMPFEIDHYMDFDDYETLVANKNKSIGISQTDSGHKPFFINKLDYVIATGLVKIIAWPKEAFDIVVPETFSSVGATSIKYFEQPYFEEPFE